MTWSKGPALPESSETIPNHFVRSLLPAARGKLALRAKYECLVRHVFAKVLEGNFLIAAVSLDVSQCLVDGGLQLRVALAENDAGEVGVLFGGGNAQFGVGLVLLVIQEGQAVVDGGIHAAGSQQLQRIVKALYRDDFCTEGLRQLAEVAGQGIGGLFCP